MITEEEKGQLLTLARRVREISETPLNQERRTAWKAHHVLKGVRPMILIEAHELVPLMGIRGRLKCKDGWAREIEEQLLTRIWRFEELGDDAVVEPVVNCAWRISQTGFGVELKETHGSSEHGGSSHWDPVITDLDRDVEKLHCRRLEVNRERSLHEFEQASELFDDILNVRMRGMLWWTTGMTADAIKLMGMESFLMGMFDNPQGIQRLMSFLRDDQLEFIRQAQERGILTLNNEDDYVGSGTIGYVSELSGRDITNQKITPADMWVLSESQETVGVSPQMFAEFIFPYQQEIVERFGLTYYGCCEPLHERWSVVKQISNLRAVSISPWCDQEFMADALKRDYVFCRKPNPTLISTENFDENAIEADLRKTVETAQNCNLEIVMKDIHTINAESSRPSRWVEIARRVCGTEGM
jgi:hypothetical protein